MIDNPYIHKKCGGWVELEKKEGGPYRYKCDNCGKKTGWRWSPGTAWFEWQELIYYTEYMKDK